MPESANQIPCSPSLEIAGLPYFCRLCDKVRLRASDRLHPDYHPNLGRAMDLWTCQFLGVDYEALAQIVKMGASDEDALAWARKTGVARPDHERDWWLAYMTKRGFQDDLSERLEMRKEAAGFAHRNDIQTFMKFIEVEENQ